jgi:hypothetical protein
MTDINVLRQDYETQVARANRLEERLKEVLKENEELRLQIVNLRNNRVIFVDTEEEYEIKGRVKVK